MSEKPDIDYEIIAVNDSSPDDVLTVLKELAEKDKRVMVVDLAKNVGKHGAEMAGFSFASGDFIVALDADGQCPMDKLWELIEPLYNGYDISIAKYPIKKQSAFKNFGSKMNALMAQFLIEKPRSLYLSNFSAMKRFVIDEMIKYDKPYPYLDGLKLWLNGFTAFSVKPLRISAILGLICAFIGFVYGTVTVINKLAHPEIQAGYSSTMAVLLFIGGMIMMMLGMVGEYIGRIYICINNSPQYVIRETINMDRENK